MSHFVFILKQFLVVMVIDLPNGTNKPFIRLNINLGFMIIPNDENVNKYFIPSFIFAFCEAVFLNLKEKICPVDKKIKNQI